MGRPSEKIWTDNENIIIKENYGKICSNKIGELLNLPGWKVRQQAKRLDLINKNPNLRLQMLHKYSINEDFFNLPNTTNCYWAGFLATDGCMYRTTSQDVEIRLKLNIKDEIVLLNLKNNIEYSGPIIYPNSRKECSLTLTSIKICNDLSKHWNITPRKTFTLQPPNISDENLVKSYIIGAIDGDGTICYVDNKYLCVGITSASLSYINWFKYWFDKLAPHSISNRNIKQISKVQNWYNYHLVGKRAIEICKILDAIKVSKLDRKWSIARRFF